MTILTVAGRWSRVPDPGRSSITAPLRTVHEGVNRLRERNPLRASVDVAAAGDSPTVISGTGANGVPLLTTSCTCASLRSRASAFGCWLITRPAAIRVLYATVVDTAAPGTSRTICARATFSGSDTRFGAGGPAAPGSPVS